MNQSYIFLANGSKDIHRTLTSGVSRLLINFRHLSSAFFLVLIFNSLAFALEDGCHNISQWAVNRTSGNFTETLMVPNGWPTRAFTLEESMNTFYPNGYGIALAGVGGFFCAKQTGDGRSCLISPPWQCSNAYFYLESNPEHRGGKVGERMPAFPSPTYPNEWDFGYYYKGIYEGDESNINTYLLSRVDPAVKDSTTSVTQCDGIEIVGDGDTIGHIKRYVINNVKTVRQHFEQWYAAYQLVENYGVCGSYRYSWLEGLHGEFTQESQTKSIPVEVTYRVFSETITSVVMGCPPGATMNPDGETCSGRIAVPSGGCPRGWAHIGGPFGTAHCSSSDADVAALCSTGLLQIASDGTKTCVGGEFSNPRNPDVHICGSISPGSASPGEYDGSVQIDDSDIQGKLQFEISPPETNPPPDSGESNPQPPSPGGLQPPGSGNSNSPDPDEGNSPETNPPPDTGEGNSGGNNEEVPPENSRESGSLGSEGLLIEGRYTGIGFTGSCESLYSDVEVNKSSYPGIYPRGLLGNDCKGPTCLINIARCEFNKTKLGRFVSSFSGITGPGSLPRFTFNLGSLGSNYHIDFNEEPYVTYFNWMKKILLLGCFVVSLRILAS